MISRRDAFIGAACTASLGAAEWLRPRRSLNLLGKTNLDSIVPRTFDGWSSTAGGDFVVPQTPNSLSNRLYAKQLMRVYTSQQHMAGVMLLIAYGASQSDALQLHRPESCYPAVGLPIAYRTLAPLPIAPGVTVPGVLLTAGASQRIEDIAYWTRLGEYLPQSASDQRRDRLRAAVKGYVGDGVLVRASILRHGDQPQFPILIDFLGALVEAVRPDHRSALVGSRLASAFRTA
jgi:EpsI family protein